MLVEPNTLLDEDDSWLSILVIKASLVAWYAYSYFKSCCCLNTKLLHYHRMHVENEFVEIVTTDNREFKEIIEEYEEEILVQEESWSRH